MAERRMFARAVTGSARFLQMPATTRLLYYDLGIEADDDGCVEAFGVIRKTGASEDDLRVLVSKGFIRMLNDDLAVYIVHWNINNHIRKDRYHPGIYKALIDPVCSIALESGNQVTTEVRADQYNTGEARSAELNSSRISPIYSNFVPPTLDEVSSYCMERRNDIDPQHFIDYYATTGWMVGRYKMRDWQAAIRSWERNSVQKTSTAPCNPFMFEASGNYD